MFLYWIAASGHSSVMNIKSTNQLESKILVFQQLVIFLLVSVVGGKDSNYKVMLVWKTQLATTHLGRFDQCGYHLVCCHTSGGLIIP